MTKQKTDRRPDVLAPVSRILSKCADARLVIEGDRAVLTFSAQALPPWFRVLTAQAGGAGAPAATAALAPTIDTPAAARAEAPATTPTVDTPAAAPEIAAASGPAAAAQPAGITSSSLVRGGGVMRGRSGWIAPDEPRPGSTPMMPIESTNVHACSTVMGSSMSSLRSNIIK